MPIIRRSDCVPLPIVVCPFVAVVILESWVERCAHCVENVGYFCIRAFFVAECNLMYWPYGTLHKTKIKHV